MLFLFHPFAQSLALTQLQDKLIVSFRGDSHATSVTSQHFAALSHEFKHVVFCTLDCAQAAAFPCGVQTIPAFHFIQVSSFRCARAHTCDV